MQTPQFIEEYFSAIFTYLRNNIAIILLFLFDKPLAILSSNRGLAIHFSATILFKIPVFIISQFSLSSVNFTVFFLVILYDIIEYLCLMIQNSG